jgi:hypothetical protein
MPRAMLLLGARLVSFFEYSRTCGSQYLYSVLKGQRSLHERAWV